MMIRFAVLLLIAIGLTAPTRAGLSAVSSCPSQTSAWSCPVDLDTPRSLAQLSSELPGPAKAITPSAHALRSLASASVRLCGSPDDRLIGAIVDSIDRPPKPSAV